MLCSSRHSTALTGFSRGDPTLQFTKALASHVEHVLQAGELLIDSRRGEAMLIDGLACHAKGFIAFDGWGVISIKRLPSKTSESFLMLMASRSQAHLFSLVYFKEASANSSKMVVMGSHLSRNVPSTISTLRLRKIVSARRLSGPMRSRLRGR